MKRIFVTLVLFVTVLLQAQTKEPNKVLDAVRQKFNKAHDYKADVSVKLDMSFIKVPDMKAKVYFKQPDKIKVESDGFAMLPRQGLKFSPAEFLKGDFTPLFVRSETIDNRKLDVIKIIPNNDSSDVVLSTLWIDAAESVIRKVEVTGKKGGTTKIDINYDNSSFGLPSQIILSFNLGDLQMPASVPNQPNSNKEMDEMNNKRGKGKDAASIKGKVIMNYTNYQINQGIPDSFFVEKEKEKRKKVD